MDMHSQLYQPVESSAHGNFAEGVANPHYEIIHNNGDGDYAPVTAMHERQIAQNDTYALSNPARDIALNSAYASTTPYRGVEVNDTYGSVAESSENRTIFNEQYSVLIPNGSSTGTDYHFPAVAESTETPAFLISSYEPVRLQYDDDSEL